MKLAFTIQFNDKLEKIKKSNPEVYIKIKQKLKLFEQNPSHPSLRTHKLKGNLQNTWSISIDKNFRLVFFFDKEQIVFFYLGTHDELYK